jgi:hypothetical protein
MAQQTPRQSKQYLKRGILYYVVPLGMGRVREGFEEGMFHLTAVRLSFKCEGRGTRFP